MTVNRAFIADIASEFATADSDRVDRLVVVAATRCPERVWTDSVQRDFGIAYLVAHMLKVDALRGAGAVTGQSIGDVSVSYAGPTGTGDDALSQTAYGREFLSLRRGQARGPLVTG